MATMKKTKFRRFASMQVLLSLLLIGCFAGTAEAHVLKQDNGIAAVLHIIPEDNPQALQPTKIALSFAGTPETFSLAHCRCQVAIIQNTKQLQTVALIPALAGATLEANATLTFPAAGVYDLSVSGTSTNGSFTSFKLDYLLRVASPLSDHIVDSSSSSGVLLIGLGSVIIISMIGYTLIRGGGRYTTKLRKLPKSKS